MVKNESTRKYIQFSYDEKEIDAVSAFILFSRYEKVRKGYSGSIYLSTGTKMFQVNSGGREDDGTHTIYIRLIEPEVIDAASMKDAKDTMEALMG